MARQRAKPGNAEMEVLTALWDIGPASVREIDGALRKRKREWAVTTIHTLLSRLKQKCLVSVRKKKGVYVFEASLAPDKMIERQVQDLMGNRRGRITLPIVKALVSRHDFTDEELAELREIINNLDAKG